LTGLPAAQCGQIELGDVLCRVDDVGESPKKEKRKRKMKNRKNKK